MNTNCKAAFNDILLDSDGEILPCCYIERPNKQKNIQNFSTIKDWFDNDSGIKDLRHNLSNGVKDTRCNHCWKSEAENKWTLRSAHPFYSKQAEAKLLHITGGRLCNMACRMCAPELSSMINAENRPWQQSNNSAYNWIDDPVQSKKIVEFVNSENINNIQLQGGEPQIMKGFVLILEGIDKSKKSKIDLQVTTNASVFNEKFWQQAVKFNRVTAGISIDAVGSRYEIIRYHGKWNTVRENCERILEYIWEHRINPGPNPALNLNIVTQLSNVDQGNEMNSFYQGLVQKFNGISSNYTLAHVYDNDPINPWDLMNIPLEILKGLANIKQDSKLAEQWHSNIEFARKNNSYDAKHGKKVLAREKYFKQVHGKNLWDERPDWHEIYEKVA
jgi:radical SAM protein with 4Fe4S-binding SPASM domain